MTFNVGRDPDASFALIRRAPRASSAVVDARVAARCATCSPRSTPPIPGIRFRMIDEAGKVRPHVQVFVGMSVQRDPDALLKPGDEIMIVGALSGG